MKKRIYLDVHVLQTVPPSCVNRDDTGSPKTAIYGGTTRARVSSQAWKRAMREMFRDEIFSPEKLGSRTKHVVEMVADEIRALAPDADAEKPAKEVLKNAGVELDEKKNDSAKALFFMSKAQAEALAKIAVESMTAGGENKDLKKKCKEALKAAPSIDIALFGRMAASAADLNCDAAAQVAHSISTHTVQNEYDYFTAVDDLSPEDSTGAGHLGTVEFNSSTLYRYATVNLGELAGSLGKSDTPAAVRGFVEAFVRSMPTGKQNTFANRTLPDVVYVTIRRDQPVNLCGAFEIPVHPGENGFAAGSVEALFRYADKVYSEYAAKPAYSYATGTAVTAVPDGFAEKMPLDALLDRISGKTAAMLDESEGE